VGRVAIVTDSASDFNPARAAELGITVVPLIVSFGNETFSAGVNLSIDEFWTKLKSAGSVFPTTAACSPGDFQTAYQRAFDAGALGHDQVGRDRPGDVQGPRHLRRRLEVGVDG